MRMLHYEIYVNGELKDGLSETEYKALRREVLTDVRYWGAVFADISSSVFSFIYLGFKFIALTGGVCFWIGLFSAPLFVESIMTAQPHELADAAQHYAKLVLYSWFGILCLAFLVTKSGERGPTTLDKAVVEKVRQAKRINRFSTIHLDCQVLPATHQERI